MTARQAAMLNYHRDIAAFAVTENDRVFVILDLEDWDGFAIASEIDPGSASKRKAIAEGGAYPALTLTMPLSDANRLLALGWPDAKRLEETPEGFVTTMLISEGRCLSVLIPRPPRTRRFVPLQLRGGPIPCSVLLALATALLWGGDFLFR